MLKTLIILVSLVLLALALWEQQQHTGSRQPRERADLLCLVHLQGR